MYIYDYLYICVFNIICVYKRRKQTLHYGTWHANKSLQLQLSNIGSVMRHSSSLRDFILLVLNIEVFQIKFS